MISPFCTYPPTLYSSTFTCDFIKNGLYQICKLRFKNNNQTNQHDHKSSPISGNRMDTGRNHSLLHAPWSFYLLNKEIISQSSHRIVHNFLFYFYMFISFLAAILIFQSLLKVLHFVMLILYFPS